MRNVFAVILGLVTGLVFATIGQAADLPDLGGKQIVVVTENAYPPLQFIDPKTGKQIGWEYDAMAEIAKRLNIKVEYQNTLSSMKRRSLRLLIE